MKRVFAIAIAVFALNLAGCTSSQKQAAKDDAVKFALQAAPQVAQQLTFQALKKASVKSPNATAAAALALSDNLKNDLIPYFNGSPLLVSEEVAPVLNSKLTAKFDPTVLLILNGVVAAADNYVALPAATKLSDNELQIIRKFLAGVQAGCDQYLALSKAAPPATSPVPVP